MVKCSLVYNRLVREISFSSYSFSALYSLQSVTDNRIAYAYKQEDRTALDRLAALRGKADQVLIVKNKWVTDTGFSKVVLVREEKFYTSSTCLLNEVRCRYLPDRGVIEIRPVRMEETGDCERVILINAMIDIEDDINVPVSALYR